MGGIIGPQDDGWQAPSRAGHIPRLEHAAAADRVGVHDRGNEPAPARRAQVGVSLRSWQSLTFVSLFLILLAAVGHRRIVRPAAET